jgi:hypothetical protein
LPDRAADVTSEQNTFLDQSVAGLAQEGKVVPVRLALFAEMVKGKTWSPSALREVGGTEGVGVTFLEETFASAQSNPKHRLHQKAAQAVLKALLPRSGTDIKGQMRSEAELREASGYAGRPRDFDDLVHVLDLELRLITPAEPDGPPDENPSGSPAGRGRYYQLTHDYLVHSLRDWLTRKQRETRRGRAELRLAERTAIWSARPENRHLPSIWEGITIRLLTRKRDWTEPQRAMMRALAKYYTLRGAAAILVLTLGGWWAFEALGSFTARLLIRSLESIETKDVPATVLALGTFRRWADPGLRTMIQESKEDSKAHLHASLALLPVDPTPVDYLSEYLVVAGPGRVLAPRDLSVLCDALAPHRSALVPKLWTALESANPGDAPLLPSAGALALYDPEDPRWAAHGSKVAQALVTVNPVFLGTWLDMLRPVRNRLTVSLAAVFRDKARPETEHTLATNILADYARDDPGLLAELLMDADSNAYKTLFPIAERRKDETLPVFQAELAKNVPSTMTAPQDQNQEPVKDRLAERQAQAAITLVRLGQPKAVWPLLRHSADPRLRSFLINRLNPLGVDAKTIADELTRRDLSSRSAERGEGSGPPESQRMDSILFHPETSTRRALILALGTYGTQSLSPGEREP